MKEPRRARSIRWKVVTDEKAKERTHELHLDQNDGGVSRYLELLVEDDYEKAHGAAK